MGWIEDVEGQGTAVANAILDAIGTDVSRVEVPPCERDEDCGNDGHDRQGEADA